MDIAKIAVDPKTHGKTPGFKVQAKSPRTGIRLKNAVSTATIVNQVHVQMRDHGERWRRQTAAGSIRKTKNAIGLRVRTDSMKKKRTQRGINAAIGIASCETGSERTIIHLPINRYSQMAAGGLYILSTGGRGCGIARDFAEMRSAFMHLPLPPLHSSTHTHLPAPYRSVLRFSTSSPPHQLYFCLPPYLG
jgi:hypothetical protein